MPINSKFLQHVFHINNSWSANWGDSWMAVCADDKYNGNNTTTSNSSNYHYSKANWHYNQPYTIGAPAPHTSTPYFVHGQNQQYVWSNFAAGSHRCVDMIPRVIALQVVRMLLDHNFISDVRAYTKVRTEETIDVVVVSCAVCMRENTVCTLEVHIADNSVDVNVSSTDGGNNLSVLSLNKSASYHDGSSAIDLSSFDGVRFVGTISDESLVRMEKVITDFIVVMTKAGNDTVA